MSANDPRDPDADSERTMMIPTPGGRRAASAAPGATAAVAADTNSGTLPQLHGSGLNALVRAANPLLDLIMPLRAMVTSPNLEVLRQQLVAAVKTFESEAKAAQVDPEAIAAARFALCTFVDETISGTPWGSGGVWASRSLLVTFHNEAWGGEKFFLILQRLTQDIPGNIDVLELMYLCLALGLEGRYRVIDRGPEQLTTLRERLQQLIQTQRGAHEPELALRWRGLQVGRKSMLRLMPLWVMAALAGVLLLIAQLTFSHWLNSDSDPVFASLMATKVSAPPVVVAAMPAVPKVAPVRVAGFLAPEIAQGLVSVVELDDRSTITLRGDGVFGSGSVEVAGTFEPLLARIGDALKTVQGKVVVIGHTDNIKPGVSARVPSNWALSKARAGAVVRLLAERAGPLERYVIEGRGDTEPLVENSSAVNRARNRRVDIVVLVPTLAP
ncbi:MAG: type VI secretion system protein ImpK [Burkholderiaceae bacterium]|jgi:type VI secretion system protein ImpK